MPITFSIFFLIAALMPGFFLLMFFRDAWNEYKATGKYFWETLLSSPGLFAICLVVFLAMLAASVVCLILAL